MKAIVIVDQNLILLCNNTRLNIAALPILVQYDFKYANRATC
jgi:hypothetical protein